MDFTHSVSLGPIIVNIITKNKIDVTVMPELGTSACQASSSAGQYYFSLSLSDIVFVLFCQLSELIGPHRFLASLFENSYSLAFQLVLQKHFHDFSLANVYSGTFFWGLLLL